MRKTSTEPPFTQSSKGAANTLNHTTLPPPLRETDPGGKGTQSFSIWLLPVELPRVKFYKSSQGRFLIG